MIFGGMNVPMILKQIGWAGVAGKPVVADEAQISSHSARHEDGLRGTRIIHFDSLVRPCPKTCTIK